MTDSVYFASSWQRLHCLTCREETIHRKNRCVHCQSQAGGTAPVISVQINGRKIIPRVTAAMREQARRMFASGTPPRIIAQRLHVSPSTVYRLNLVTRG